MKKLFLPLIVLPLFLMGCNVQVIIQPLSPTPTPSPTPAPITSPIPPASPTPSPLKAPLNLAQITDEVNLAINRIKQILSTYPISSETDWPGNPKVIRYDMVSLTYGVFHEVIHIEYFQEAEVCLTNVRSLAEYQKLPGDTTPRIVNAREIREELFKAIEALQNQKEEVLFRESSAVNWINNYNQWRETQTRYLEAITPEYQKQCVYNAVSFFDDFTDEINNIINRLKIILDKVDGTIK